MRMKLSDFKLMVKDSEIELKHFDLAQMNQLFIKVAK